MTTNTSDRLHRATLLQVELLPAVLFLAIDALSWVAARLAFGTASEATLLGALLLLPALLLGAAFACQERWSADGAAPQTPLLLTLSWIRAWTIAGGYALLGLMVASPHLISHTLGAIAHWALVTGCIAHIAAVIADRRTVRK
ncbi:hypothetical protein [Curtobacterium sp. MCBD17_040]|uniref:hypothetical protein n=1 Tax=Curtobacterium sp. MCBD17_040 TaxID=2175674 RepID=UPI000DA803ED|nr:hypothetical protein [Curtobacterium sp. MCBD17_040]WIB65493.1 hypothetical protein DEI94_19155 [Curtobacterium sp. MCBD17_040]